MVGLLGGAGLTLGMLAAAGWGALRVDYKSAGTDVMKSHEAVGFPSGR